MSRPFFCPGFQVPFTFAYGFYRVLKTQAMRALERPVYRNPWTNTSETK